MNPSLKAERLDREKRLDPERFSREYEAEFAEDLESFLPTAWIEAAVVKGRHELPSLPGVTYIAAVDPSGGVEIFRAGRGADGRTYTAADLQAMVDAHAKTGFLPPIRHECGGADAACKVEMTEARKSFGLPALGYVTRLYLRGDALMADLSNVPRRLAEAIRAHDFERVAVEIYSPYVQELTGRKFSLVLKSISFVGAVPALTDLDAVEGLYDEQNGNRNFRITTKREEVPKMLDYEPSESDRIDAKVRRYMQERGEPDYAVALRAVLKRAGEKRAKAESRDRAAHPSLRGRVQNQDLRAGAGPSVQPRPRVGRARRRKIVAAASRRGN